MLLQFVVSLFDIVSHASNFFVAVHRVLDQIFERIGAFHVLQDCIGDIGNIDAGLPAHPVCPVALIPDAVNQPGATRIGTVGRPIPGNAVRISPLGEIELKGDVLFSGYWHNEEATAAVFDDGWFRTGDLGAIDADGFLRIVGRQKEIIVTAGGKNVAPAPLEAILGANPVVGHAMIVGEGRPFVGALVTLDPAGVRQWAQDNGRATDAPLEELARDELLRATIQTSVDEASATVSRAEGIKKFTVLPEDFSEAGGELTPTLKIKRSVVEQKYARQIKHLYGKH